MVAGAGPTRTGGWYRNRRERGWLCLSSDSTTGLLDISEPDESGRVQVSGTTEDTHRRVTQQAVRWTLEPDGNGGWRVAALELLPTAGYGSFFRGAFATAINRAGQIVGTSGGTVESGLPVLWPSKEGWTLTPAVGAVDGGRRPRISTVTG
jgi:hypothetical protein